jgi:four helix bundle protein
VSGRNYTDLIAWRLAMDLAEAVCIVSGTLPASERFGLSSQMRRAATSIPANIAEGQGRRTRGEFLNHLSVAHGSLRELETHIVLARRLGMIDTTALQSILNKAAEVGRLINGLANSLERNRRA